MRIISRMNVGGPAVQIVGLMRGLKKDQFNQVLITGYCDESESDYLEASAPDVPVLRISGFGKRINAISDLKVFFKLISLIREIKPNIIHTHTAKAGLLGRLASIFSGVSSIRVHTFHGHLLHGYFSKTKTTIVILIERLLALFTDKIVSVGVKVKDDLIRAKIGSSDKYVVVPPGIEIEEKLDKTLAAELLDINPDKNYCLFLGRVTKIKRPDRLLDIAQILIEREIDLTILVAGAGEELKGMIQQSEERHLPIKFLGWQNNLGALFGVSQFLVSTSDNEGTPVSIIQAQMAGLPIVATDVGSTSEVLIDKVSGFLTKLDIQEIADKIIELTKDLRLRNQMGEEAIKFSRRHFGTKRLISDIESLYKDLIINQANS
jgi:glycosyltransferase involved in cell wall biosynthesis